MLCNALQGTDFPMNRARQFPTSALVALALAACTTPVLAATSSQKEARVTQIIRDVKLLPESDDARPAEVNDRVHEDTAVRTGDRSRSELTFLDLTIARLGADSVFSFREGGRDVELGAGSMLLRVPKNSNGGAIRNQAVTVGITGTTVIFESHRTGRSKLIVLEGHARISLVRYPRQRAFLRAGQMVDVPAGATTMPAPVNINLQQVMNNSPLITDFPPLPSRDLIADAIRQQQSVPSPEPIYQGRVVGRPPGFGPVYPRPHRGVGGISVGGHHHGRPEHGRPEHGRPHHGKGEQGRDHRDENAGQRGHGEHAERGSRTARPNAIRGGNRRGAHPSPTPRKRKDRRKPS